MEYLHNYSNEGDFIRNYYRDIVLTSVTIDDEVYTYHKTAKTPGGYSAIWTNGTKYIMSPNVFESPGMPYIYRLFDVTDFYPDFIFPESDYENMHLITGYTISSFGFKESDYRKPFVSYEKGGKSVKYNKLMIDIETTYGDVPVDGAYPPGTMQEGITKLLIDGKEMPINDGPVKIQCDTIKLNGREADACLGEPCDQRVFGDDSIYPLLEDDCTKKVLSLNNCQTLSDFWDIEFENRRYPYFRELDVKKCFYESSPYEHPNYDSGGIIGFYCFNDLILPFNDLEATSNHRIEIKSYIGGSRMYISVYLVTDTESMVTKINTILTFGTYEYCYVQDIIDLVNENTQPWNDENERYTMKQPFFILQKDGETKLYCGRENIHQMISEIWEDQ